MDCSAVRDLLPERAHGLLDEAGAERVDAHLAACAACGAELTLVRRLQAASARPPEALAGRLRAELARGSAGARASEGRWHLPDLLRAPHAPSRAWALASAATLVLALGTAVLVQRGRAPSDNELWQAFVEERRSVWMSDDGVVAGAPVLEDLSDLSDEALAMLLEELGG